MYCYIPYDPLFLQDEKLSSARYLKYINSIIIAERHYFCIVHFVTFVLDEKRSIHLIITILWEGVSPCFHSIRKYYYISHLQCIIYLFLSHISLPQCPKPSYHPTFLNLYRTAYSRLHIELNHFRIIILFCNATEEGR